MSQALHLDFLGGQRRLSKARWLFLVAGIVLAVSELLAYSQLLRVNVELRSELDATLANLMRNKQDNKRQPVQTPAERSATSQAYIANKQLNYPWDALLNLVETVQHSDVALLSLEPKSKTGQIRLTAEAKDALAMTSYISSLQQNPLLQNALLTTHQIQVQQPGSPFKFQILAQWIGAQPMPASDTRVESSMTASMSEKVAP